MQSTDHSAEGQIASPRVLASTLIYEANEVVEFAVHLGECQAIDIPENLRSEITKNLDSDLR